MLGFLLYNHYMTLPTWGFVTYHYHQRMLIYLFGDQDQISNHTTIYEGKKKRIFS